MSERGFTLIEVMVVVLIIGLITAIVLPMYANAIHESRSVAFATDSLQVYNALMRYYADHSKFPADDELDLETLAPLTTLGYIKDATGLMDKLVDDEAMIYLAPDIGGVDQQFILLMRLEADDSIIAAVVHTDFIEATDGWVDGVYIIDDEDLEEAPEAGPPEAAPAAPAAG